MSANLVPYAPDPRWLVTLNMSSNLLRRSGWGDNINGLLIGLVTLSDYFLLVILLNVPKSWF